MESVLSNIEGIGDKRRLALMKKYRSVIKMKEASIEELKEMLPDKVAVELYNFLKEMN